MMDDLTLQGIQALKTGDKDKARSLFLSALEKNEDNLQAWLWLSGAVSSDQDQLECLQQVLRIDPENQAAKKGVALLTEKQLAAEPSASINPISNEPAASVVASLTTPVAEETSAQTTPTEPAIEPEASTQIEPAMAAQEVDNAPQAVEEPIPSDGLIGFSSTGAMANEEAVQPVLADQPVGVTSEKVDEALSAPETGRDQVLPEGGNSTEDYKLPDSFFAVTEQSPEPFPDWMNAIGGANEEVKPTVTVEEKSVAQHAAQEEARPAPSTTEIFSEFLAAEAEKPAPAKPAAVDDKANEKVLLKFRPSLSTSVIVYGLGLIVLFFLFILMTTLVIKNVDQTQSLILLGLVFLVILVVLVLFIARIVDHLTTSYFLTNRRIYLEKGIASRKRKSVFLVKIKDLTMKRGLLQSILGMGNLLITSEGQEGDEVIKLVDVSNIKRVVRRIENEQNPPIIL